MVDEYEIFPFGKYKDCFLVDIPTSYLVYALENFTLEARMESAIKTTLGKRLGLASVSAGPAASNLLSVYRILSKKYHPDMGGDTAAMQAINEFYNLLKQAS